MSNLDPQLQIECAQAAMPADEMCTDPSRRRFLYLMGGSALGLLTGCSSGEDVSSADPVEETVQSAKPNASQSAEQRPPVGEFAAKPSWEQDFSRMPDGPVDTTVWRFDLDPAVPGWNDEKQGYTNSQNNVRIESGALVIEAHKQTYQYPNDPEARKFGYTSGRIDTLGSKTFLYGRVEADIKLPAGNGTWPALWMLPSSNEGTKGATDAMWESDGRLYLKNGSEIDIMEHAGSEGERVESTFHPYDENGVSTGQTKVPGYNKRFVTYAVEWTPRGLAFFADGKKYHEVERPAGNNHDLWNADGAHYLILNLAMGGTMGGQVQGKGPWRMEVSGIRHYDYVGTPK